MGDLNHPTHTCFKIVANHYYSSFHYYFFSCTYVLAFRLLLISTNTSLKDMFQELFELTSITIVE